MDKSKQIEELKAKVKELEAELDEMAMTPAEKKIEYAAGAVFERIVGGKVIKVGCEQLGRICQTMDGSLFMQANGRVGEEPSEVQSIWFHIELPDGVIMGVKVEEAECITIGPVDVEFLDVPRLLLTKLIDGCARDVLSQCAEDPSLDLQSAFLSVINSLPELRNMELVVRERALEINIARHKETANWP